MSTLLTCFPRLVHRIRGSGTILGRFLGLGLATVGPGLAAALAASVEPASQSLWQETAVAYGVKEGLPSLDVQLTDIRADGRLRVFAGGRWADWTGDGWHVDATMTPSSDRRFSLVDGRGSRVEVELPWPEVRQVVRRGDRVWVATAADVFGVEDGQLRSLGWSSRFRVNQVAADGDARLVVASSGGLFRQTERGWERTSVLDERGRDWAAGEVLAVAIGGGGETWIGTRAGAGCQTPGGWRFFEGKDGLPYNQFTWAASGSGGAVWFGTRLGLIRYERGDWHYRQGPRWLPHDEVRQVTVDGTGSVWVATPGGVGVLWRQPMTLAAKAEHYEGEIERHVKRTEYGFVAEAPLRVAGDRATAQPQDSDNDGLWTAMYGAGECFAYGATKDPRAKLRARQAFEALRFLQKVTQGGPHAPPKGFVARTVRPVDWPDPNVGRLEADREQQKRDAMWKVYEPRWPRSADGKWYWKGDTSSDELDGHFFFYPLYYDLCAEEAAEKERVREVVRDLADHLVAHGYALVDHDGRPTRWGVFGPDQLNRNPWWWPERGLNSLSILSYLAVAQHITGEARYAEASRRLIDDHGYAQNLMFPKVQNGPGSGNQSDDEMAFMCFYSLLRHSRDEALKTQARYAFYAYWANEEPEMNPFFNFAYAAHNLEAMVANPFGEFALVPWEGWLDDSMSTLRGFPLDRLDWPSRNSHRLDLRLLERQASVDLYEPRRGERGLRVNGRVLPVENRHFGHWNTDPWRLDYGGGGLELGAGTVFLLPYYMGMYHGFIERP